MKGKYSASTWLFMVALVVQTSTASNVRGKKRPSALMPSDNLKYYTEVATSERCRNGLSFTWPHAWDCMHYYRCKNGTIFEGQCSQGLHFQPELQMCVWQFLSSCVPGTPEVAIAITNTPEEPYCPENSPPQLLLPNLMDCSKFYICTNGIPVGLSCPKPLQFNNDTKICDWPQLAGCSTD